MYFKFGSPLRGKIKLKIYMGYLELEPKFLGMVLIHLSSLGEAETLPLSCNKNSSETDCLYLDIVVLI